MEHQQTVEKIPEQLTLNGIVYLIKDHPELVAFVDQTRKAISIDEKKKVYSQTEALAEEIKKLKGITPVTESNTNELASLKAEIMEGVKALIEPLTTEGKYAKEVSLAAYRNQLLADNQGKIIPELVVGNSREELDAALAKSLEIFEKYANKNPEAVQTQQTTPLQTKTEAPATTQTKVENVVEKVPPLPTVPNMQVKTSEEVNIKGMSMKEFENKREELEQKIKELIPS